MQGKTHLVADLLDQANALHQAGRLEEAEALYRKVLAHHPRHAIALSNLATVLLRRGAREEGVRLIGRSLEIDPDQPDALNNYGIALCEVKRYDDALANYDRAIALRADFVEAYSNRGAALKELKRFDEALSNFDRATALEPGNPELHAVRANVLMQMERYGEALGSYDHAIALQPDFARAYNNRGVALRELGRHEDALASYERAIAIQPGHAEAHNNRGNTLKALARHEDALASYERAIVLEPGYADAHWNKSLLELLVGNYDEGWRHYEWRWSKEEFKKYRRDFAQPLWLGETPIEGKSMLVHAEQGLGDAIQMLRYVPLLARQGARVIVEVPKALLRIAATAQGVAQVVQRGAALPDFELHCPLMSLPLAFKTTLTSIPAEVPYLSAPQESKGRWHARLGPKTRARIGLTWSGAVTHKNDHNRSIGLQTLLPLLDFDGEFFSLQKEYRAADEALLRSDGRIRDYSAEIGDLADTAALIDQLDLVLSVDTSVAHLAGALAKPVWVLLPHAPEFRWFLHRFDSPWYPSARLFRQPAVNDWQSVTREVLSALARYFPGLK